MLLTEWITTKLFPSVYRKGRRDGWQACEKMILRRAEEHADYGKEKVWRDLVQ